MFTGEAAISAVTNGLPEAPGSESEVPAIEMIVKASPRLHPLDLEQPHVRVVPDGRVDVAAG